MKGNYKIVKLQTVQEKMTRYCQILRRYGPKLTFAYYLTQQSDSKYYDFSKNVFLDFVLKLRREAKIDESNTDKKEVTKKDFKDRMKFTSLYVFSESANFYFDDGDLFWGHTIEVTVNQKLEFTNADIAG